MAGRQRSPFNLVDWFRARRVGGRSEFQRRSDAVEEEYGNVFDQDGLDPYSAATFDRRLYGEKIFELLRSADMQPPEIRVAWDNLTLEVPKRVAADSETVGDSILAPFKSIFAALTGAIPTHKHKTEDSVHAGAATDSAFKVLDGVSGYAEPGELVLFLSPPRAGVSTLFSLLSYTSSLAHEGEVLYNGFNVAGSDIKAPKNWIRLIGQEDTHYAVLSVRETLQFAADMRTDQTMPFCERVKRDRLLLMARTLGIERALDTVVGDEELRGISGGEKKRVTIAEMLVGGIARLIFMDNFSKGLDSQTTLDIVRNLREVSQNFKLVFIVSMQQPSNEVFNLFDKVCIMDGGKNIFFGPRAEAEPYFTSLGFERPITRSVPDFLATISDPEMRSLSVVGKSADAPKTADDLKRRFEESDLYKSMMDTVQSHREEADWSKERYEAEVPAPIRRILEKDAPNTKRYQFRRLIRRSVMLEGKDQKTLLATIVIPAVVGLVIGFLYFRMDLDFAGARNRASLLFLCGVYIGLGSLATMSKKYEQKYIYAKHKKAGFYEAGPFIFATAASDVILAFVKSLVFSLCVYFVAGLNLQQSGLRFGYFIFILWATSSVMEAYVRALSVLIASSDVANAVAGLVVILFINFAGFLIPRTEIEPWFIWVYWISPLRYSNDALIVNEFRGLEFECTEQQFVPPGNGSIIPPESQVCPVTTGEAYMTQVGYFGDEWWKYLDVAALWGLYLAFLIIATIGLRSVKDKPKDYKVSAATSMQRAPAGARTDEGVVLIDDEDTTEAVRASLDMDTVVNVTEVFSESEKVEPAVFSWKDVSYSVPISKNENKLLLDHVSGYAKPGRVVALMGSSGAGKTTLLDVLAQRKTLGTVTGTIEVNGNLQNEFFPRISGYCEQMDIHMAQHTVREALEFSAKLRLDESIPMESKIAVVERTLDALDLRPLSDKIIGSAAQGIGISSEARKRVTIGVELVTNPRILFLDEPTSGLDSRAAIMVMKAIRRVARLGCAVVCTIHQPSSEIFDKFDDLLLLKRGGKTVFFGELGMGSVNMLEYFQRNGAPAITEGRNPADYMLETIGAGTSAAEGILKDWAELWSESPEQEKLASEFESGLVSKEHEDVHFEQPLAVGQVTQFKEVLKRAQTLAWRSPEYNYTRLSLSVIEALLLGVIFLRPDMSQAGLVIINGALFLTLIPATNNITNVISPTMAARPVLYRETSAGTYNDYAYFVASGLVELPYTVLAALIFGVIYYFLVGLTEARFGFYIVAAILVNVLCVFIGQGLSWACPTETIAASLAPVVNILGNILSGFLIPKPSLPAVFAQLYWANPFQYYLTGIVQNEFEGAEFFCEPEELIPFRLPTEEPYNYGECSDLPYRDNQIDALPNAACGAPADSNISCCGFCGRTKGEEILMTFDVGTYSKWYNLLILFGFISAVRVLSYLGLRFLKHNDR